MVVEIAETLEKNFNKDTLTIELPRAFFEINTKDAKIELVTSNSLCPI